MQVAIITTNHHNVGDDFVREGILYLLNKLVTPLRVTCIHKHIPLTVRSDWEWYYTRGFSSRLDALPKPLGLKVSKIIDTLPLRRSTDKILNSDLLIQSGAPVYWVNEGSASQDAEWWQPLIERRWKQVRDRVALWNIAAGTCQAYGSDGSEFQKAPLTLAHIRTFFDYCQLTTVRDELSSHLLRQVGRAAPVLPCTSIFARKHLNLDACDPEFIALNYMPAGGHYDFQGTIQPRHWENTFVSFAKALAVKEKCVLVCHNQKEYREAKRLLPDMECFYSEDHRAVLQHYGKARFGVVNRVHAAFAMASFGRPAFVIGTDTRAHMTKQIQLDNAFVMDVTQERLFQEIEHLKSLAPHYQETFATLSQQAERGYLELMEKALTRAPGTTA